jgi:transketolase
MTALAPEMYDCRQTFASELLALAAEDERIVAVCNDSVGSSNLVEFRNRFPDRLVNVGIAEQDMVGVAAGLANGGLHPFVCAASPFLTGRALEQIKADIAYSKANVVLCGMSPGVAYGELGPTHHSLEDLSWLRAIPDLPVVVPADPVQTRAAVRWAAAHGGPAFLRIGRTKVPAVTPADAPFEFGRSVRLADGDAATIIASGTMVSRALAASESLRDKGIRVRVLNVPFIDPLDVSAVLDAAATTGAIVTVEEAMVSGGLGAAVASLVAENVPVKMRILGVPGRFAPTGDAGFILEHFGLTSAGIVAAVHEVIDGR